MNLIIKHLVSIGILVSCFAELTGEVTLNQWQRDTIVIASEPDYPPYCMLDENNEPVGFSVDLFRASADAAGLEVKIKIGVWSQIKEDLAHGRIDALPLVGRTPEREDLYDFTMPYISLHGAVFVRKGTDDINSVEDLKGKEIIVMRGDNAEEFVRREKISDHIITTATFEEAFRQLAAGEHDAVVIQRVVGLTLLDELRIKSVVPLGFQIPQFRQDFCFAVKKGDEILLERLNEGLSIIIANNAYETIRNKWFGPVVHTGMSARQVIRIILFVILPLVMILIILWIIFLRHEVVRRTANLNLEIEHHQMTMARLEDNQRTLKESEEQIRLLLNSTAEGIFGIDNSGVCTFINNSALDILGYLSPEEVTDSDVHKLIHHSHTDGSSFSKEDCLIFNALRDGGKAYTDSEVLWKKDGSPFEAEYFSYPIRNEDKITGAVVTFWDITERKKAERELLALKNSLEQIIEERTAELNSQVQKLNRSQTAMLYLVEDLNSISSELKEERRKLEYSNSELEAFTYSVSHDLRAPLRAIDGFSKFLMEDYYERLDDEGKRYINTIRANASKMDQLILDMLNLSRISRATISMTEVDMGAIAESIYMEIATEEEKQQFEVSIEKGPVVKCDAALIKQVWQNLIGNALKYSSRSDLKRIEIGHRKENGEVIWSIKDQGAGFNPEYKHKLFGVFQRLHRSDEFEGTGVGLAIIQRIIQRHGGRVWAEGEINRGATFSFALRVEDGDS
ncbi:MAG: transporter substrate-binding domain-containing protein [Bacteroidales bacterium]|nr:transporter substrate-binding domain-containing protein [Bacteroidales bacterium]